MSRKLRIGIIGSGPSGAAAAWALRNSGNEIEMLDVGNQPEPSAKVLAERLRQQPLVAPELSAFESNRPIKQVRQALSNLLAKQSPSDLNVKKLFGSTFAFKDIEQFIPVACDGYQVPRSLAKGGLSNVWGAACYPFTSSDLAGWPVQEQDLAPHYREVGDLIGLSEKQDGLAQRFPVYSANNEVLMLNPQAKELLNQWNCSEADMARAGFVFGQARLAVLTKDRGERRACDYKGLCLTGCPNDSIYSSAFTVDELSRIPGFKYRPGIFVRSFEEGDSTGVTVQARDLKDNRVEALRYDKLLIGAGTLSTLRLVHQSMRESFKRVPLLDNTMFLLPLLKRSKRLAFAQEVAFTLSQLVLLIENQVVSRERIHTQLYSYSNYVFDRFRPAIKLMPRLLQRQVLKLLYNTFIMFIYLPGDLSSHVRAELTAKNDALSVITLKSTKNPLTKETLRKVVRHLFRHRSITDLFPITAALKTTQLGFSGHLAGSFPMTSNPRYLQTYDNGLLYGYRSVYLVDASTFPSLPPQNCTYTAMANAHRIASYLTCQ